MFIRLANSGEMEKADVIEYCEIANSEKHITDEDAQILKRELDEALGHTPEQIRDSKLRLLRMFIGLASNGSMDKEEVIEYIEIATSAKQITDEDAQILKRELDEKVG